MGRSLGLLFGVLVLVLEICHISRVQAQELAFFNKSSGVDFEKDNVYAEIMPVVRKTATTIRPSGQKNATTTTDYNVTATTTNYDGTTASARTDANTTGILEPMVTAETSGEVGVAANEKTRREKTKLWEEPKIARVIDPIQVGTQVNSGTTKNSDGEEKKEEEVARSVINRTTKSLQPANIDNTDLREDVPPYITSPASPKRLILFQHKAKTIQCEAEGHPLPEFAWFRNDLRLSSSGQFIQAFPNGTLHFPSYSSRENGLYHCTAENAFGKALSLKVPIVGEMKPELPESTKTRSVVVKKLEKAKLDCGKVPNSIPVFLKKWYKQATDEVEINNRIGIDSNGTLRFAYAELGDANNEYTCGLAPPSFQWSKSIQFYNPIALTVQDSTLTGKMPPNAEFVTKNGKAVIGESFVFECFFSGNPVPHITWKNSSNHDILEGDPRYTIYDHNRKLKVKVVRQEDEGLFKCTATNNLATREATLALNVTSPPVRADRGSLITYTKPDQGEFTLTCKAQAALGESLDAPMWYRNAERITDGNLPDPRRYRFNQDYTELTIRQMNKQVDTASFQCLVANSEGSLFMNGYLRVISSIEITRQPADIIRIPHNTTDVYDLTVMSRGDSCCRNNRLYYFNDTQLTDQMLRRPPFMTNETEGTLTFSPASVTKEVLQTWVGSYRCRVSNPYQDVDVMFRISVKNDPVPVIAKKSSLGLWWIGILCGVIAIIIAIVAGIIIYKSNYPGETYQLEKTELKHNLNPEEDLLNQSFQEI